MTGESWAEEEEQQGPVGRGASARAGRSTGSAVTVSRAGAGWAEVDAKSNGMAARA